MNFPTKNNFFLSAAFLKNEKGSLLIFILFLLMIMSLFVFSVGYAVKQKLQVVSRLESREKLRFLGEAAGKIALDTVQPGKKRTSYTALNEPWASAEVFQAITIGNGTISVAQDEIRENAAPIYGLVDEERKVNINEAKPVVLRALFQAIGMDNESARLLAASVQDWRDEDEDLTDGGAESKYYQSRKPPYRSKNGPFATLDELKWVKDVTPEVYAKLRPYLTLTATKVNINTASSPVLIALGIDSPTATKMLQYRKGKDSIAGTKDDGVFQNLTEAADVISRYSYLTEPEKAALSAIFNNGTFTVESNFFSGQVYAKLNIQKPVMMHAEILLEKEKGIRQWHEKFS